MIPDRIERVHFIVLMNSAAKFSLPFRKALYG